MTQEPPPPCLTCRHDISSLAMSQVIIHSENHLLLFHRVAAASLQERHSYQLAFVMKSILTAVSSDPPTMGYGEYFRGPLTLYPVTRGLSV